MPTASYCQMWHVQDKYWAHKNLAHCDKWWENETEWHRQWKDLFPIEWQEFVAIDEKTGEKHIADIKTNENLVVEFQHSNISEEERISRERFYKDMIWIVDGTRRKRDFTHFAEAFKYNDIWGVNQNNSLLVLENCFWHLPKEWLHSSVPVLFDFKGLLDKNTNEYDNNSLREPLWCLMPVRGDNINVLFEINRSKLIEAIRDGGFTFDYPVIINEVNKAIQYRNMRRRFGYY